MGQNIADPFPSTRVAARIRHAYLFAVAVIATVSIGAFAVEHGATERFDNVAEIINTSGKQRMLALKILISSEKFATAPNESVAALRAENLGEHRETFVANHQKIMSMGAKYGGDDDLTEASLKIYYGGRYALDDQVRAMDQMVSALLEAEPYLRMTRFRPIEYAVNAGLIEALDAAVSQFERDAKVNVIVAARVHKMLLSIVMLVLIAELIFIFRPLARLVDEKTRALSQARDEMRNAALHDPLTGLANRRLLGEIMTTTMAQSKRVCRTMTVCQIDLDHFKAINDTRGHAAGDAVLKHVAVVLRDVTRGSDFIARVGGDEFVVVDTLLGDTNGALVMAQRIIERLSKPFDIEGEIYEIGGSVGIAQSDPNDDNAEAALHRADVALYYAKELGRGRAVIYSAEAQTFFDSRVQIAA